MAATFLSASFTKVSDDAGCEVAKKSKSKSVWKHILYVCVFMCAQAQELERTEASLRLAMPALSSCHVFNQMTSSSHFCLPEFNKLSDHKPVHPFSFSLARMAHLDQGQIIIQNGLWLFQTHPKIHAFLSLLTDSWHKKRARILPGIVGSQREKMVRKGGTVGIR